MGGIATNKKASNPETLRLTKKEQGEKSRWVLWAELMKRVFVFLDMIGSNHFDQPPVISANNKGSEK